MALTTYWKITLLTFKATRPRRLLTRREGMLEYPYTVLSHIFETMTVSLAWKLAFLGKFAIAKYGLLS